MSPTPSKQKCVVIGEKLLIGKCPLADGACTWKHRANGTCMYSSDFDNNLPSPQAIAVRVGAKVPNEATIEQISQRIITQFKEQST